MRKKLEETARKEYALRESISKLEELNLVLVKRVKSAEKNEKSAVKTKKRQSELAEKRLQSARISDLYNLELKDEIIMLCKEIFEMERDHAVEVRNLEGRRHGCKKK